MKKSKITIKHYLHKQLKPDVDENNVKRYRVYVKIIFRTLTTPFKSILLNDKFYSEAEFSNKSDKLLYGAIKLETDTIRFLMEKVIGVHDLQDVNIHEIPKVYNTYYDNFYLHESDDWSVFMEFLNDHNMRKLLHGINVKNPIKQTLSYLADFLNTESPLYLYAKNIDQISIAIIQVKNLLLQHFESEPKLFLEVDPLNESLINMANIELCKSLPNDIIFETIKKSIRETIYLKFSAFLAESQFRCSSSTQRIFI